MIEIYLLTNRINGKRYVGQTSDKTRRFAAHCLARRNTYLHRAIRKYGWENFEVSILDTTENLEEALQLEQRYIKDYESYTKGYNLTEGGEGTLGRTPWNKGLTKTTSAILKLVSVNATGVPKPKSGREWTVTERLIISRLMKDKPKTEEHRKRLSESLKGRSVSKSTRAKMSAVRKGKSPPEYACPHCHKKGKGSAMFKWHFDKCKDKI